MVQSVEESSEGQIMLFVLLCMLPGLLCGTKEVSSSLSVLSKTVYSLADLHMFLQHKV